MKKIKVETIFNDSDEEISDDASVSHRRLSSSNILNVEENDDTKEKRAKRKSLMIENGSNNMNYNMNDNNKVNQQYNLPSGYTEDQIVSHYGNCIKLASENKINSKNAFNLHLIDYLKSYVHELQHFKSVGSSLDAGNKIYASRVDSIHQNTYQVLTGLGNSGDGNQNNIEDKLPDKDGDNAVESDVDELEGKTKKSKRKINAITKTISQNKKKIRINASQIRSEVDPLFQSQAENFDEGGSNELRLNNLQLLDRTYELLLDSEKVVNTNYSEDQITINKVESEWFDVSLFKTALTEVNEVPISFCDQFEDFLFTGWKEGNEIMNSTTAESFRNMLNEVSKLEEENQMENGMITENVNFEPLELMPDNYTNGEDLDDPEYSQMMRDDKTDDDDDNIITIVSSKADNYVGNILMSSVRGMVNSFVEHYGEMNDKMLGMWAGPLYWKQKAKELKIIKTTDEKRIANKTRTIKEFKQVFPDKIDTKLNENGIGRMVIKDCWKFEKNDKVSTQLTENCLSKNVQKECLLPPRIHFSYKSINQMMNREISLVNKTLKKYTDGVPRPEVNDDNNIQSYDYNNPNDILEFCPQEAAALVADDEGNVIVNNNEDCGFDDDDYSDRDAYNGQTSFQNIDFGNEELEMVTANVKHVEQIDIEYAKTAKCINVVKLKNEIWSNLKQSIGAVDVAVLNNQKYPALPKSGMKSSTFSDLLIAVDKKLSKEASKDLSVSILMTCLLLLANETGLDIANNNDFSDLILGQGYSEYDLEQISIFGVGNCLLNDSRKRKSGEQRQKVKRQKSDSLFSEDYSDGDN